MNVSAPGEPLAGFFLPIVSASNGVKFSKMAVHLIFSGSSSEALSIPQFRYFAGHNW